jgi:MFS family permease
VTRAAPPRFFYGWIVVAATFVVLFVVFGVAYSFAAFFTSFQNEFHASRGDVSLIFSICGFVYFLLGAGTGMLSDRVGPRWVVTLGMLFLAAGLYLASHAVTLWQVYATYGIGVGLGVGFAYVPAIGAVQPWFTRRRGLASGLAVSGIGVGTLVVPLCAVWLIERAGWREAFAWLAAGSLVLGVVAALLLDNAPGRRGFAPDNAPRPPQAATQVVGGTGIREALATRIFWLYYASILFCSLALFIPFVHLAPYARDNGLSERTGVLLMGLIGAGSIIGRFVLAGLADRLGRRQTLTTLYVGMMLTLAWWLGSTAVWSLALFAVAFGTFYGGFVALGPALTMDFFGAKNVSGLIGLLYTAAGFGTLAGPTLAGAAYDMRGSYSLPIALSIACVAVAAVCALRLPKGKAQA